jgi:hypothetical protein
MSTNNQTSIHLGAGFQAHVTWNAKGTIGIDQHGTTWYNRASPVSETGMTAQPTTPLAKEKRSNKDFFMDQREGYYSRRMQMVA